MHHGAVAGLRWGHILGLMQRGEGFLFVAVNQVASGEIDPVWPTRSRWALAGIVNFCERLTTSVPSSISTASPTDQILTLVGPKHSR